MSELTPEQRTAAGVIDRNVVVMAGPGSGKTRVLVSRYLNILEQTDIELDRIVAITFTKKAAAQMRERIRLEFDARIDDPERSTEHRAWRDRKRRLEGAAITTIHGFCARLLRENPVEAGVDPHFSTLEDHGQVNLMRDVATRAVVRMIDTEGVAAARLVGAFKRERLTALLHSIYTSMRGIGIAPADLPALPSRDELLARYVPLEAEIDEAIGRMHANANTDTRRQRVAETEAAWVSIRSQMFAASSFEHVDRFVEAIELLRGTSLIAGGPHFKPAVLAYRDLVGSSEETGRVWNAYFDVCAAEYQHLLVGALSWMEQAYTAEKSRMSTLDFEDLQMLTRALLRNNPEVGRRVRQRYRYFLVDEFQDTNGLQAEIVELLAHGEPAANLFIVGDSKQSVYGFRGAEVDVFALARRRMESEGAVLVTLDRNFRSSARLIAGVNRIFGKLMRLEPGDDPEVMESLGFVDYVTSTPAERTDASEPAIELIAVPALDEEAGEFESARDEEARRLAARIVRLVSDSADEPNPRRYRDVAILLRAMTDVKVYERALRELRIPYYVVAGTGFYDRQEIVDLLNLVGFLDNRTDELSLAAVLRSPLFGISDASLVALRGSRLFGVADRDTKNLYDELAESATRLFIADEQRQLLHRARQVLDHMLGLRNRVSIAELLETALEETEFRTVSAAAADGAHRLSNIDKLVELARTYERTGTRLLRDFVEYVAEFQDFESREAEASVSPDTDAVAILTIHKSKGLEFPIVVMPDLHREIGSRGDSLMFDRALGIAFKVPDGTGGLARTGRYEEALENRRLRERFESMRLLYVGMTRAEELLILSGVLKASAAAAQRPLRDRSSWLEWIVETVGPLNGDSEVDYETADGLIRVIVSESTGEARDMSMAEQAKPQPDAAVLLTEISKLIQPVRARQVDSSRYSASDLQLFAACPRKYYLERVLMLPGSDDSAAMKGSIIHRFCERLESTDDAGAVEPLMRALVAEAIVTRKSRGSSPENLLEESLPLAYRYFHSQLRARLASYDLVRSEVPFAFRIGNDLITGTIDRLAVNEDGDGGRRALVVDFKTGALTRGTQQALHDHLLQMQIYAQAVRSAMTVEVVDTILHYLGSEPDIEVAIPAELISEDASIESISATLAALRGADSFMPRTDWACGGCPRSPFCPL